MASYTFPANAALEIVQRDLLPRITADRPIFDILPIKNSDNHLLIWTQMDNIIGVQQARGMDGQPPRVKKTGAKQYIFNPGIYGEFLDIDEQELTAKGSYAVPGAVYDLTEEVSERQLQLKQREMDRIEQLGWLMLTTGTFSVAGPTGAIVHQDTFSLQTFTSAVTYATYATATPLADFRFIKTLHRGKSVSFGSTSKAYANQTTINNILLNANNNDVFGRRVSGLMTINNVDDLNTKLFLGDDLPQLVPYDEGYIDDNNTFQLYIPTGKIVVVGKRPGGTPIGEYRMTRNANNVDMAPGPYIKVVDNGDRAVPRNIAVHGGHNGGPLLLYFGSVVVVNC